MHKSISLLALLLCFSPLLPGQGQPFSFRYQGVAYDGNSPISSDQIAVRLAIHESTPTGTVVYEETRENIEVNNGLFGVTIGSPGTIASTGLLGDLDWGLIPYFLETQISISNDPNSLTTIGTTEILGAPWLNPVHTFRLSSKSTIAPEYGDLFIRGGAGSAANYFGIYHFDGPDDPGIRRNFWFQGAGNRYMDVSLDGSLVIGALKNGEDLTHALEVTGSACKSMGGTSWAVCSDPRIKKNIKPLTLGLATLKKINPIWFEYDETMAPTLGKGLRLGLNAEEINSIPELNHLMIETHDKFGIQDLKMITSSEAIMYLNMNAIKEQQDIIETQAALIASQQKQLGEVLKRIESLERMSSVTSASADVGTK